MFISNNRVDILDQAAGKCFAEEASFMLKFE